MNRQEKKAAMRSQKLAVRDAIPEGERIEKSIAAAEHAQGVFEFPGGTVVSAFFPIRSEIDPRPLMDALRKDGARLCLPVVLNKTTIVFRELVRGAELVDTGFGTWGPGEDAEVLDPEILIMPLSVFDLFGGRIGYGAGHYDRAISRLLAKGIEPKLIGLAFDCQRAEKVPVESHDQLLNGVITESGFFETREERL